MFVLRRREDDQVVPYKQTDRRGVKLDRMCRTLLDFSFLQIRQNNQSLQDKIDTAVFQALFLLRAQAFRFNQKNPLSVNLPCL